MSYATLTPTADGLAYRSSYDPALVAALKAKIPYDERRWDPDNKCWLVLPGNEQVLATITQQHLGVTLRLPGSTRGVAPRQETRLLDVRYIGAPKERGDGTVSAFGYSGGEWAVIFPEDVLKNWFELGGVGEAESSPTSTLYGLLGAKRSASEQELKRAYRKMAKRWHPDVSKEDDAAEMMKRINDAWKVLGDPMMRRRYDAGLALEASLTKRHESRPMFSTVSSWRPPVRCGYILAEGTASLGRFLVDKILAWEDITDAHGRTLVTSWPAGANHFTETWI